MDYWGKMVSGLFQNGIYLRCKPGFQFLLRYAADIRISGIKGQVAQVVQVRKHAYVGELGNAGQENQLEVPVARL